MLAKKYRFHSRGGVRYTYKNGRRFRDTNISLISTANSRNKQRFAVVVSKKVLKSAVGRNRIRRRTYEAIRLLQPKITKPTDCIFIINTKEILTLDFSELIKLIRGLLVKSDLL